MADGDFDGVHHGQELLAAVEFVDDLVFEAAQGEEGLGEEVSAAGGGVEEFQGGEFFLEGFEAVSVVVAEGDFFAAGGVFLAFYLGGDVLQFFAEGVEE